MFITHLQKKNYSLLLALLLIACCPVIGQKTKADSLLKLSLTASSDSAKVRLMWSAANAMNRYKPDSALQLAQEAFYLAQRTDNIEGESRSLGVLANTFMKIGNYPRALELNLQKLKLEEKRNVPRNLASVLMNIGIVYALQEQYREALKYYARADSVITKDSVKDFRFNINLNIGDTYNRLNVSDSAFLFFNKSLQIAKEDNNEESIGLAMTGLGHSYLKLGSLEQSLLNYRNSIIHLRQVNNDEILCEATLGLANLYRNMKNADSSAYYAKLSLHIARQGGFNTAELEAADFLSQYFQSAHKYDSAFSYISYLRTLNDTLNSKSRIRESQIITSNEQFRQAELAEQKKQEQKKRNQQLQMLLIAIFIPGIFLLTLFFTRVSVHPKAVRLLGILSLLFLFEYLTLLLHPFVSSITHHTPLLEILIFVGVAALVIPLHHKLEHWLIHKLSHYHHKHLNKKAISSEEGHKKTPA
jgi:tetratricopeptide (TPR) repeat protein